MAQVYPCQWSLAIEFREGRYTKYMQDCTLHIEYGEYKIKLKI